MTSTVEWFFGRGLSIGCGLTWTVPPEWNALPRADQITRIKAAILSEMSARHIDVGDIRRLLDLLANRTAPLWTHQFHTTNWDYLLQRKVLSLGLTVQPPWCAETHVYHLNGTVEELPNNSRRSNIVLETDPSHERVASIEGNVSFNKFIWSRMFVVVGMSFECEVDKYLLSKLKQVEDDLPIGESQWVVVNPNAAALAATCARLQAALPGAKITSTESTLRAWIHAQVPELQACGAIAF